MTPAAARLVRRVVASAGATALAAGVALGVATAAGPPAGTPAGTPSATSGGQAAVRPGAAPRLRAVLSHLPAKLPAKPLHVLIAARLRAARQGQAALRDGRIVIGRLIRVEGNVATVRTAAGQTREVRILPRTRGPAHRLALGDRIIAIGQPAPDGSLIARAVAVRPG